MEIFIDLNLGKPLHVLISAKSGRTLICILSFFLMIKKYDYN